MIWTRATVVVVAVLYVGLWVLAANGATSLVGPLLVPLVLAVLVGGGVAINRFLGTSPRSPRFAEPPGEAVDPARPVAEGHDEGNEEGDEKGDEEAGGR